MVARNLNRIDSNLIKTTVSSLCHSVYESNNNNVQ
jgi:hypothetical protein